jgi:omega-amidase
VRSATCTLYPVRGKYADTDYCASPDGHRPGQPGGALAICYDLRFPELFRSYATRGAGVILLPSEWPHPRLEHWRTLVQARAIENQCFLVACNRVGADRNSQFCGHSLIVDPWGTTLVEGGEDGELLLATLDLTAVAAVRERMTVLRDRRPELYTW